MEHETETGFIQRFVRVQCYLKAQGGKWILLDQSLGLLRAKKSAGKPIGFRV